MNKHLANFFLRTVKKYPDLTALECGEEALDYKTLCARARLVSQWLAPKPGDLAGVYFSRTSDAYVSLLGILLSGKGYVPLNPAFPAERTLNMVEQSGAGVILVCAGAWEAFVPLLDRLPNGVEVVIINFENLSLNGSAETQLPAPGGDTSGPLAEPGAFPEEMKDASRQTAYLLFTSGSTGNPKGVGVTHENVCDYVSYILNQYPYHNGDRTSQTFDLTFDLSVHDMFVTWGAGSALCVLQSDELFFPAEFIRRKKITCWFSVPTLAVMMHKMRVLEPGAFPSLKLSLFCGEPLTEQTVKAWAAAAEHSQIENIYGPTEATIAVTRYLWKDNDSTIYKNGLVPIGKCFETQEAAVVDVDLPGYPFSEKGELWLSGSQITPGYWRNLLKTSEAFVPHPKTGDKIWYRTGDLVERDEAGCLHYLSRLDGQIKIAGYRIELGEVEHVLRTEAGHEAVACVPWPVSQAGIEGITAFVVEIPGEKKGGPGEDGVKAIEERLLHRCQDKLPSYMVPKKIVFIRQLPTNANGKVDRKALVQSLKNNCRHQG